MGRTYSLKSAILNKNTTTPSPVKIGLPLLALKRILFSDVYYIY
jgi:hypothetical protein